MAIGFVSGVLILVLALSGVRASIKKMPAYVRVPTNPPPQFAAALGDKTNFFVSIPFAQAVDKFVTQADLEQIKQSIPRAKTIGRMFTPTALVIESPTKAEAEFWRRRTLLHMTLIKTGEIWKVEYLDRGGQIEWIKPPGLLDKLEKKLPF